MGNSETGLKIELATMADLESLYKIESQVHLSPWSKSLISDSLKSSDAFFKLSNNTEIIGYMLVMSVLDEMELLNIAIAKTYQGQGFAKQLMQHLLMYAQQNQVKRVFLEVRESNIPAIKLYQKFAFQQVGLRKNYYLKANAQQNTYENALVMQCQID